MEYETCLSPHGRLWIAFPVSVFSFKCNHFSWAWGYPVKDYISQTPFQLGVVTWLSTGQCDMNVSDVSNFLVTYLKYLNALSWSLSPFLLAGNGEDWSSHLEHQGEACWEQSGLAWITCLPWLLREKWTTTVVKPPHCRLSLVWQLSLYLNILISTYDNPSHSVRLQPGRNVPFSILWLPKSFDLPPSYFGLLWSIWVLLALCSSEKAGAKS